MVMVFGFMVWFLAIGFSNSLPDTKSVELETAPANRVPRVDFKRKLLIYRKMKRALQWSEHSSPRQIFAAKRHFFPMRCVKLTSSGRARLPAITHRRDRLGKP
jgi:hypothetical protein